MSDNKKAGLADYSFAAPQYLLPHHALSRTMRKLSFSQSKGIKSSFINTFRKFVKVNLDEAEQPDPAAYSSFNQFFTRALKPGARPIAGDESTIVSPVDGAVSQAGDVVDWQLFQAKGHSFDLVELLGGDTDRAAPFADGHFATIYLSPKDYHRIHMPLTGALREMTLVPGRLFSVNPLTARAVPRLFARNERVVTIFDTEAGPMAIVLVGAMFVASIETVWHGEVSPPHFLNVRSWEYSGDKAITLQRGEEMGRFNMGSTAILLFPRDTAQLNTLSPKQVLRLGEAIGSADINAKVT